MRPVAVNDTASGNEDTVVTGDVEANDTDADGDTLTVTQFVVGASTVTVDPVSGGSISLAEGDLTINADGSFTFTPAASFNGSVPQVTYTISDGALTDTATLDITIDATPDAVDDFVSIKEDGRAVLLDPLANDDLGGGIDGVDDVAITAVPAASQGVLTYTQDGTGVSIVVGDGDAMSATEAATLQFTPSPDYNGVVTVPYVFTDLNGNASGATIEITVVPQPEIDDGYNVSKEPREQPDFDDAPQAADPLSADGAVLDALAAINGEPLGTSIGADGVVVSTANAIDPLNSVVHSSQELSAVRYSDLERRLMTELGPRYELIDAEGFSGFSLKIGLLGDSSGDGAKDQVVIETLVREKYLMIQLSTALVSDARTVVDYEVHQFNGQQLPEWLDRADQAVFLGERPADVERIALSVTVIYDDGSTEVRNVEIETKTGNIRPIIEKQASSQPLLFQRQFNAMEMPADHSVDDLSKLLKQRG